ncbi:hypothetical protein EJ110_NYTH14360 [Nymphaea thermarum]|nr:hypothetical protein EJ110_NYTH14360 [Nymphaea thermarum]
MSGKMWEATPLCRSNNIRQKIRQHQRSRGQRQTRATQRVSSDAAATATTVAAAAVAGVMYSFHRGVTFPYDHILFGEGPERSTYISLESKPLAPEWYRSWHPTFSRMFPSYFEECGLETVATRGMQSVDGNLVHAIAERWNPRTSSFWFPWGEMTILLEFVRYDGTTCPHVHLSTFFNDCYKIRANNRALFRYFPRSLEGITAQWYKENVNPVELKEFDKAINMFVERFEQNAPMAPTLSTICSLRQKQGEKAREFIQKWRIQCNKMKEPISETQVLSLIRKNLAQPLKSLIRNAPIKTFTELIEQANSIEEGIEEGDFDGIIAPKYKEDVKKGGKTQLPTHIIANAGIRKDQSYKQDKEVSHKRNMQFSKGDDEKKNKHPG